MARSGFSGSVNRFCSVPQSASIAHRKRAAVSRCFQASPPPYLSPPTRSVPPQVLKCRKCRSVWNSLRIPRQPKPASRQPQDPLFQFNGWSTLTKPNGAGSKSPGRGSGVKCRSQRVVSGSQPLQLGAARWDGCRKVCDPNNSASPAM